MPLLIQGLLGFFSSTGPLAIFFYWIGKAFAVKAFIVPLHIVLTGILLTAKIASLTLVVTLFVWFYNQVNLFLDLLNNTLNVNNEAILLPLEILNSLGFFDAVSTVFSMYTFVLVPLLTMIVLNYIVEITKSITDEFFKVGMLIGV